VSLCSEKEAVIKVTGAKDIQMEYGIHIFIGQDFRNMTSLTVWGIRPTPGGIDWINAKRIFKVMKISGNHFVTVEILLHEGLINVNDCKLVVMENDKFFTLIQPVFEFLSKLLKQSGIMNHLQRSFSLNH
ncbi:hypothetical protein EJD97_006282, partial [Solanum chilense]